MKRALGLIVFMLCSSLVFGLTINDPQDMYQLGDKLFVTTTELKGYPSGNLNVDLMCGNTTVNLLKISARAFSEEGGQSYSIPYKILTKEDLEIERVNSIVGSCFIRANLANEVVETKRFLISNKISVEGSVDKLRYNPGEDVVLELKAKRSDGGLFNGYYALSNFTDKSGNLSEGEAEVTFNVKETMPPGKYFLRISVFNEDSEGEILNNGSKEIFVIVNQVITAVQAPIDTVEIVPGDSLRLNPKIVDQAGSVMEGMVTIHVIDPEENKYDYTAVSGETIDIPFPTNATKGTWQIYTVANGFSDEAQVNVLGVERVNYSFENSVLTVKNVGNVDYFGEAEIKIGEMTERIQVKLGVGKSKEFILEAPEGEYEISVNDGENSYVSNGFLTGNAVKIREVGSNNVMQKMSLMWLFLMLLLGGAGFVMIAVYRRTKVVGEKKSFTEMMKGWGGKFRPLKKKSNDKKEMVDLTNHKKIESAESALVLNGEKITSTVVSVKMEDKDSFNEDIQRDLIKVIKESSGSKGVVDVKENYIYLIYSPLITKSFKNEILGVTVALQLKDKIDLFKKNLKGNLKYGIGVHTGDLVSQKTDKVLKYTGIGNTISLANKIANESDDAVFVSEKVRRALLRDVKVVEKRVVDSENMYRVESLVNRDANQAKLKDLLKRMD